MIMINYPVPLCSIIIHCADQAEWKKDFIPLITKVLVTHLLPARAPQEPRNVHTERGHTIKQNCQVTYKQHKKKPLPEFSSLLIHKYHRPESFHPT